MLSPIEAEAVITVSVPRLPSQNVPLIDLAGRVLRQAIRLIRDQPPYDRVSMDGVALASSAWQQGIRDFHITGTQAAGAAPLSLSNSSHCIEVMTGAMTPIGCDCVIPVEKISIAGGIATLNANVEPSPWLNIHRRAYDGKTGTQILEAGTLLGANEVAVIASCGYAEIMASRMPRIAVISTGDELKDAGTPVQPWQLWRSNSYAVMAALKLHGLGPCTHDHLPDNVDVLRTTLNRHLEDQDVLVLSGGVSAGRFDYIPQVLQELGVTQLFKGIAQRPGKPMWFGTYTDNTGVGKVVFALPGNPVSTAICLRRYVIPGLLSALGASPRKAPIALASNYKAMPGLTTFVPARLMTDEHGQTYAHPCPTQGSGDFISLVGTDGFMELPARDHPHEAGSIVTLYRW